MRVIHRDLIFIGVWVMVASIGPLNLLTAIFIDALTSSTNEGKLEMRERCWRTDRANIDNH